LLQQELAVLKKLLAGDATNPAVPEAQVFQNYPNPFGNSTVTGQEVYNSDILQTGDGSIQISNNGLAPGSYIYNPVTDGVIADFKKMVLER
jgi:hypothetical protein